MPLSSRRAALDGNVPGRLASGSTGTDRTCWQNRQNRQRRQRKLVQGKVSRKERPQLGLAMAVSEPEAGTQARNPHSTAHCHAGTPSSAVLRSPSALLLCLFLSAAWRTYPRLCYRRIESPSLWLIPPLVYLRHPGLRSCGGSWLFRILSPSHSTDKLEFAQASPTLRRCSSLLLPYLVTSLAYDTLIIV